MNTDKEFTGQKSAKRFYKPSASLVNGPYENKYFAPEIDNNTNNQNYNNGMMKYIS